jgi:hypothetical protein
MYLKRPKGSSFKQRAVLPATPYYLKWSKRKNPPPR